jgi:hypothetical protein
VKEIVTTSANFLAILEDGKLTPQIELGITTSEVEYGLDYQGVTKSRICKTIRFSISPEKLRKMAKGLDKFADDCDEEFAKSKGPDIRADLLMLRQSNNQPGWKEAIDAVSNILP